MERYTLGKVVNEIMQASEFKHNYELEVSKNIPFKSKKVLKTGETYRVFYNSKDKTFNLLRGKPFGDKENWEFITMGILSFMKLLKKFPIVIKKTIYMSGINVGSYKVPPEYRQLNRKDYKKYNK